MCFSTNINIYIYIKAERDGYEKMDSLKIIINILSDLMIC